MQQTFYPLRSSSGLSPEFRTAFQHICHTLLGHRFRITMTLLAFKEAFGPGANISHPIVLCDDYKLFYFAWLSRVHNENNEIVLSFEAVKNEHLPPDNAFVKTLHELANYHVSLEMGIQVTVGPSITNPTITYSESFPKSRTYPYSAFDATFNKLKDKK